MSDDTPPSLFDVLAQLDRECPTCKRPYKVLAPHERARAGAHPGVEREAAKLNKDPTGACAKVLATLEYARGGWVSAHELRVVLGDGDGPRRARQLRDEYGYPIEVELRHQPRREAWYRLTGPRVAAES